MRLMHERSPLNRQHTDLLFTWISESPTGLKRLKAQLPPGTAVAHKTGTSGTRNGITAATNDIGLISLPGGRRLAIAVFVTNAKASPETIESVIAKIGKAAYDAAALATSPSQRKN